MTDIYSTEPERQAALAEVTKLRRQFDTTTAKGAAAFAKSKEAQDALKRLDASKTAAGMRTSKQDLAALNKYATSNVATADMTPAQRKEERVGLNQPSRQYFAQVQEAMAVSQDFEGDTRVVLFITLKSGAELTPELEKELKTALRVQASPRHVPDLIVAAPELPRTKSNKLVELAVGDVINGREVRNRDALANPHALDWFKQFAL